MTSDWYVRVGGVERGPISSEALKRLAMEGKVRPETSVKKGAAGDWLPASRVTGLFASATGPVVPKSPPALVSPSASKVQTTPTRQAAAAAPGVRGFQHRTRGGEKTILCGMLASPQSQSRL